ncbi:MAG: hypothetical protein QG670_236 [Thermoproteota archaeon]|nr:hypothetical protein [Thermoproteota archaeon]
MDKVQVWEHGHAYQPRRIVDSIFNSFRDIPKGLRLSLGEKQIDGTNWFELMIKPNSVFDLMINAMYYRSIDIEPLTLHQLKKTNPKTFEKFIQNVDSKLTFFVSSLYSHPILPLLVEDSLFDAKVNVAWGIRFYQKFASNDGIRTILIWLSECAYSWKAAEVVLEVVKEVFGQDTKVVFLLDEQQGEMIDSSRIYQVHLSGGTIRSIFRCHWLSDAYAFSSDIRWIVDSLKNDIEQRDSKVFGTMIDAETYGGAYDPQKPFFFSRLRQTLSDGISTKNGIVHFDFNTVNKIVKDGEPQDTKIIDYTSWSDYRPEQILDLHNIRGEGIISEGAGGLCKWTGCLRANDGLVIKKTYFIIYEWIHPRTKQRYIRVSNSIWKVAFNTLRRKVADVVRDSVFEILGKTTGDRRRISEILFSYGSVVFEEETPEEFVEQLIPDASAKEKIAVQLVLEAYRCTNQDSIMSDPTFWQNFDTEVTWTSLALAAGGMVLVAKAFYELEEVTSLLEIAEKYQEFFLDFEDTFYPLINEYDLSLDLLYSYLRDIGRSQGFDVEKEISEIKEDSEEKVNEIAERLYDIVFGRLSNNHFKNEDTNTFLILFRVLTHLGRMEEAESAKESAKVFEWHKAISSSISKHPIPVRVGILHAKHFPCYESLLRLPTVNVEIETEIIVGEAHAYM